MDELGEQRLTGREYLGAVTALLQRVRTSHPTAGLYEAADFQFWWRIPRSSDAFPQLFWFDQDGLPEAAMIVTDWGDRVAIDPLFVPGTAPDRITKVVGRGLEHAASLGVDAFGLEVDPGDAPLRQALSGHGLSVDDEAGLIEAWIAAANRPEVSPLHEGYQLLARSAITDRPHHMTGRSGIEVERRLQQTSLYSADRDLVILDAEGLQAAYALFWYDPVSATGLVEPMRTEDDHQKRGLARHILTVGLDLLATAGAQRIKICFEDDNPASGHLYRSVGFQPDRQTLMYSGRASRRL